MKRVFTAILFVAMFAATAGASMHTPEPAPYEQHLDSLVGVRAFDSMPVGFDSGFVYANGYVVTNNHVISSNGQVQENIEIEDEGGWKDAELVVRSRERDLALLKVDNMSSKSESLEVADSPPIEGQEVGILGNPVGYRDVIMEGEVLDLNHTVYIQDMNDMELNNTIQIDAPVSPGNSGGPVINSQGEVIGVVSARDIDDSVGFAVPISGVKAMVQEMRYGEAAAEIRPTV